MKRLLLLYIIIFNISLTFVWSVITYVKANEIVGNDSLSVYYTIAGINLAEPEQQSAEQYFANQQTTVIGEQNTNFDYFSAIPNSAQVLSDKLMIYYNRYDKELLTYADTDLSGISVPDDMLYYHSFLELPLHPTDFYTGKYNNAVAGVVQLNTMPVMQPGDSIGIIRDMYVKIRPEYGYVRAPGYGFGSGVCWTTSTLGAMMDRSNANFKKKYGVDLFVYKAGDRAPHGSRYKTYTNANRGYTILQLKVGQPAQDYRITINPALKNIPELSNLKLKFVMLYTDNHPTGAKGESIGAFLISNLEF